MSELVLNPFDFINEICPNYPMKGFATRHRLITNQGTEDLFQPLFLQSTDVVCVSRSNSFTIALHDFFGDI